ncbi:hypothetical protein FRC08_013143 [Ceratobasidium sp. 394]|nr:hypothetical protein FRC08_013143 [Ceratobasidium sp. 394]
MSKLKIRIKRPFQRSSHNSAVGSMVASPSASHEPSDSLTGGPMPTNTSSHLSLNSDEFLVPGQSSSAPSVPSVTVTPAVETSGNIPVAVTSNTTSPSTATYSTIPSTPTAAFGPVTPIAPLSTQNVRRAGWTGLEAFARALRGTTISAFAPLRATVDNIANCIEIFENAAESHTGYGTLRIELDTLFHDLAGHFGAKMAPGMTASIVNLAKWVYDADHPAVSLTHMLRGIDRELDHVCRKRGRNPYWRFLQAENDIDEVLECYRRIQAMLQRLALNANINVWRIADEQATVGILILTA